MLGIRQAQKDITPRIDVMNPNVRILCQELKGAVDVDGQGAMRKKSLKHLQEIQHMNNPQNYNMGGSAAFRELCKMNPLEFVGEYVHVAPGE
ncbi:hypothetical protein L195_g026120 [Trifolium pratense]|uniref:Uncharacterized protein n=1 Tax=Trifolium pratense TaxID=57577 RepID=A0A2K3NIF2_TRIPR|nr:hypothetical protein L195_g026120 [Trifolium pratense]